MRNCHYENRTGCCFATGCVAVTGIPGTIVERGLGFVSQTGQTYRAAESTYISVIGISIVAISAVESGAMGNLGPGCVLSLERPLPGIGPICVSGLVLGGL